MFAMEQGTKSRGGRPWSFDRDAAVETAMLLFWRHGYEGVSIGDLTKAIGIAPPSLYAAFGSKAGLYQQAMARYEETLGRLDVAVIGSAKSLPEAVRLLLEGAVRNVTHRKHERGCMISSGLVTCHPDHAAIAREAGRAAGSVTREDRAGTFFLCRGRSGAAASPAFGCGHARDLNPGARRHRAARTTGDRRGCRRGRGGALPFTPKEWR